MADPEVTLSMEERICASTKCKKKLVFLILAIIVQAALVFKFLLFIPRQISPQVFLIRACPETNSSEQPDLYIFTMVLYTGLHILRWTEALIIHIHIYKFLFCQAELPLSKFIWHIREGFSKNKCCIIVPLALYMFAHSLSVPVLGILLELRRGHEADCPGYVYEYHTVYWIMDVIRYLHDVVIRLLMFLATLAVGVIWSSKTKENTDNQELERYEDYLEDREITNRDHKSRTEDYDQKGTEIRHILNIFETWFPVPWIIYLISASLDTDSILLVWKNSLSDEAEYDFSEVTYMVYNFNQLFLLILPFLCSKKMNTYHRKYRYQPPWKYASASKMALASMNNIEKNDRYDFIPRIWGTHVEFRVENPLLIVFLLVGIFFTIVEAMI